MPAALERIVRKLDQLDTRQLSELHARIFAILAERAAEDPAKFDRELRGEHVARIARIARIA